MDLNGVANGVAAYTAPTTTTAKKQEEKTSSSVKEDAAAVYEPSKKEPESSTKKIYKQDTATVNQMKADAERRNSQLKDLVTKLLTKQGQKVTDATNIYDLLRQGKVNVDPATAAQAQADIAEDGYWGVNQTSDRMLSFAQALSGGDPEKADKMMEAFKKGYEDAAKSWGGELPAICKQTYDKTIEKFEAWKNSASSTPVTQPE